MSFNHESPVRDLQVSSATGVENDKQLRSACYKEFKEAYGKDAKKILEKFRLHEDLQDTSVVTVGSRKREFAGVFRKLTRIVRAPYAASQSSASLTVPVHSLRKPRS